MSHSLPMKPHSATLKETFDASYPPSESVCTDLGKKVVLPVEEVKMWLDHLQTIRESSRKLKQGVERKAMPERGRVNTSVVSAMLHHR